VNKALLYKPAVKGKRSSSHTSVALTTLFAYMKKTLTHF